MLEIWENYTHRSLRMFQHHEVRTYGVWVLIHTWSQISAYITNCRQRQTPSTGCLDSPSNQKSNHKIQLWDHVATIQQVWKNGSRISTVLFFLRQIQPGEGGNAGFIGYLDIDYKSPEAASVHHDKVKFDIRRSDPNHFFDGPSPFE